MTTTAALTDRLRGYVDRAVGEPQQAPDPVNEPMIRHWCEALDDRNPVYTDAAAAARSVHGGLVAPPTMLQAWGMRGLRPRPVDGGSAQDELLALLDEAGYTSVVATDCEQHYDRYLRPGDRVTASSVIEAVSEEKKTALGTGFFVTTRTDYRDAEGIPVATMRFRILKFRPVQRPAPTGERPRRQRPAVTRDSAFFFDGARAGRLLVQRCAGCGRLRHPPAPMCGACGSMEWDTVASTGQGTVYSYVVNHQPRVPAFDYPLVVALVELDEGVRFVADLAGADPAEVHIGMRVRTEFVAHDDELTLPQFRPAEG